MSQRTTDPIVVADLRGGRNGADPPMSLPMNQATEALNVDWKDATLGRKRGGSTVHSLTGGTAFGSGVRFIQRHVPGNDDTAAEMFGIDGAGLVKRLAGGTSWADVSLDDAITSVLPTDLSAVTLNGKFFIAYKNTADRLHCYDPNLSSPRIRRVGIHPGASAPTRADQGAGAYAATARYYRLRFTQISGSTLVRRSEPTPNAAVFTPSGGGASVRVTRPTVPGEGETHWELEGSTDGTTFYQIVGFESGGSVAIATTTYDDTMVVGSYPTQRLSEPFGTYTLPGGYRLLLSDGNRLLMAVPFASGQSSSTVFFTPVLGSTDKGDDERWMNTTFQKNRLALNEKDGGGLTALMGPINGVPYVAKVRQLWKLRPTGDDIAPYLPRKIRDDVGCLGAHAWALGEDQVGRPALYFQSHRGPYRITMDGNVEYVGRDNEDIWRTMNLGAATQTCVMRYYPDLHQLWVWIATGSSDTPDVKMMLDVQNGFPDEHGQIRGGWAKHTSASATIYAACLFSSVIGASMSRDLRPYVSLSGSTASLKCDTGDTQDGGVDFQAYLTTRPLHTTKDLLWKVGLDTEPTIIGKALAGSDVSVTVNRDFGKETRTASVSLAPAASETRVVKKVEGLEMGEADAIQLTVGDASANQEVWTVDSLIVPISRHEAR